MHGGKSFPSCSCSISGATAGVHFCVQFIGPELLLQVFSPLRNTKYKRIKNAMYVCQGKFRDTKYVCMCTSFMARSMRSCSASRESFAMAASILSASALSSARSSRLKVRMYVLMYVCMWIWRVSEPALRSLCIIHRLRITSGLLMLCMCMCV